MAEPERHFELLNYSERPAGADDVCVAIAGNGMLHLPERSRREGSFQPLFLEGYGACTRRAPADSVFLGRWDGRPCYGALFDPAGDDGLGSPVRMRDAMAALPEELVCVVCMAKELLAWRRDTNYCGACGTRLREKEDERARVCPACGRLHFPRINPAVIVAIRSGDRLLLAHNVRFPDGIYSLVAGYVECGESLEQAVAREVREEVGIRVGNIRYRASQPWPFPASLMFGYTADHLSGDIRVDGAEISDAAWFSRERLPRLPDPGSIARTLIDGWRRDELT